MNPKLTEDRPEDLVERLQGIYPGGSRYGVIGQYKASPIEKEAAREIVKLRATIKRLEETKAQ
jgi:hypothetical protein